MKAISVLFGLPLLCLACGSSSNDDAATDASQAQTVLAKQVVGVQMLTPDARYTTPDHYLTEEFIRSNFKLEESVELKETEEEEGITYQWGTNEVGFTFGNYRPFKTMYAAENAFNERYLPGLVAEMNAMPKKPYSSGGPASQGLANEFPVLSATKAKPATAKKDTTASDSASAQAGLSAPTTLTAVSKGKFVEVEGVGDKAVWEPATHTLHVLYTNNIVNVQVKTGATPAVQQQRAAMIANVILTEVTE